MDYASHQDTDVPFSMKPFHTGFQPLKRVTLQVHGYVDMNARPKYTSSASEFLSSPTQDPSFEYTYSDSKSPSGSKFQTWTRVNSHIGQ